MAIAGSCAGACGAGSRGPGVRGVGVHARVHGAGVHAGVCGWDESLGFHGLWRVMVMEAGVAGLSKAALRRHSLLEQSETRRVDEEQPPVAAIDPLYQ